MRFYKAGVVAMLVLMGIYMNPAFAGQMGGLEPVNRTINFVDTMTTSEIQAEIDAVGKYIPYGVQIIFQFADGEYTLTDSLVFAGFYGGGTLVIQGNTTETNATSLHTTQEVYLDGTSLDNHAIQVYGVKLASVVLKNLKIGFKSASQYLGVYCQSVDYVKVLYCYLLGSGTSQGTGAYFWSSKGDIQYNYFSNSRNAIYSTFISEVFSYNNDDTGTMPAYGLIAENTSLIGKASTQPSGSSANEYSAYGGEIR